MKPITRALKTIYCAPTLSAPETAFDEFAADWEAVYPAMVKSWRDTWQDVVPFFEFPAVLRQIVYTTSAPT